MREKVSLEKVLEVAVATTDLHVLSQRELLNSKELKDIPKTLDGTGRQKCAVSGCGRWSISGRKENNGKCPFHYVEDHYGLEVAKLRYPDYAPRLRRCVVK